MEFHNAFSALILELFIFCF